MRQLCHSEGILLWSAVYVSQIRKSYVDLIYGMFRKVLVLYGIWLHYLYIYPQIVLCPPSFAVLQSI